MNANAKTPISVEFIGNYDLVSPADTVLLDTDSDYVKGCHALGAGFVQRVWVSHRNHFRWLEAFCSRTGITANFAEKTPRSLLADAWKVSLPPWLTDEIVMEEDLLQCEILADGLSTFIDVVLSLFLGESLTAADLGQSQVCGIVSSIASQENWNVASDRSLIKNCLQDKCHEWKKRARSNWEANFADALMEDPQGLWRDLSILAVLRGYPEKLMEYLLGKERVEAFRALPVEALIKIPLQSAALELATAQIEVFFHDVAPGMTKREHLLSLIGCLSGRLFREFQLLEQTLERAQFNLSLEDMEAIRRIFNDCQGVSASRLAALKRFMKPARPECTSTASSWGTSDWLKWSKEYLPFRQWQSVTGTSDSEVERMVQGFSDWYVKEYASVHQNGSLSLVHVMTGWQSSILKDELSVIVVADCVPVDFWDNLKTCLSRSGFRLHEEDYRFAPLPTETAVSKPMMIAGQWDLISKPYDILLQTRSKTDWGGRSVRYCGDLKELAAYQLDREPIILLLNFLPPDELLHGDVSQINSTYEEEANRVFARLAESLREVVEKWPGPKDRVGLYVATDHGATKILAIETKSLESKVVTKLFSSPKYRFAEVPDTEAANIPENFGSWVIALNNRLLINRPPISSPKVTTPLLREAEARFYARRCYAGRSHCSGWIFPTLETGVEKACCPVFRSAVR